MKSQMPSSVLPASKQDASPLARYLDSMMKSFAHAEMPKNLATSGFEGALALAVHTPFDPNETLCLKETDGFSPSLLEAVLYLGGTPWEENAYINWPSTTNDFSSTLLGDKGEITSEWVAAALVAQGANPWKNMGEDPNKLPRAVALAVLRDMPGLLERFLAREGAWSAQDILDASYTSPRFACKVDGEGRSIWRLASQQNGSHRALGVLIKAGGQLTTKNDIVEIMGNAHPSAIELLSSANVDGLSAAHKRGILAAWKARCASQLISPENVGKMSEAVGGIGSSEKVSAASIETQRLLSVGWKSTANGSSSQSYDFLRNIGADALCHVSKARGVVAGQWSLLAAAALSRIKQANEGVLSWSPSVMLGCDKPELDASYKDSLKGAIGFELRPGVSIDGVVALSLLGQHAEHYSSNTEESIQRNIRDFELATGVEDVNKWATQHASSAVEFTRLALDRSNVTTEAVICLLQAWRGALKRTPEMLDGLSPADRVKLLSATLHPDLSSLYNAQHQFLEFARLLAPGLTRSSFMTDHSLSGETHCMALAIHLASQSKPQDALDKVFDRAHTFEFQHFNLLKTWLDRADLDNKTQFATQIERGMLSLKTAPSAEHHIRRPRI